MKKPKLSFNERLLTLSCAVFLAAFLLVAFFRADFHSFDVAVNVWIPSIQSSPLTAINQGIAVAFDTTMLVLFSLFIAGFLFFKKYGAEGLLILGAMGGIALIVSVVKGLVQSPRPLDGLIVASGFSFPSGHATGSIVFCGSLTFLAWKHWKGKKVRSAIVTGFIVVSSLVGFSRIYLNVHWFSDVLGAGMLGVFWLSTVVLVFKLLQDRGKFESERFKSDRFRSFALFLFILAIFVTAFVVVYSLLGYYFLGGID